MGGPVPDKLEFVKRYKFSLALENSKVEGYTTEKLTDALHANTVPIYWGNPRVVEDFNPKSFINLNDFSSVDDAIEYIKEMDNNNDLYLRTLNENPLIGNPFIDWENTLCDFIESALERGKRLSGYAMEGEIYKHNSWGFDMTKNGFLVRNFPKYAKLYSVYRKIFRSDNQ